MKSAIVFEDIPELTLLLGCINLGVSIAYGRDELALASARSVKQMCKELGTETVANLILKVDDALRVRMEEAEEGLAL